MRFETHSQHGHSVSIPIAESFADCLTLIQSDWFRHEGKLRSGLKILAFAFLIPFHPRSYLVWLRLASVEKRWNLPFRLLHIWAGWRRLIDIPRKTKIGYGFYIGHGMGIVINHHTVIGNNVNISQFLNIGTNHDTPALICDETYIGPQCCVVEDAVIGTGAVIGAGAVVTSDIPARTTAVGVPAKVVNHTPHSYIGNPFKP